MSEQEFQLAVVAIVFGSAVAIIFIGIIGSIIKAAIKRKSGGNLSENKEFLEALREFKEKTDRRLSNLESIVTDEIQPLKHKKESRKPEQKNAIEIELDNNASESKHKDSESGKLRNMLNQ